MITLRILINNPSFKIPIKFIVIHLDYSVSKDSKLSDNMAKICISFIEGINVLSTNIAARVKSSKVKSKYNNIF